MAGRTVSADLDIDLASRLRDAADGENRSVSDLLETALRSFLDMAPGSRQALSAISRSATPEERDFVARHLSRQVLRAYQTVLENRHTGAGDRTPAGSSAEPAAEDEIEAEAARACMM